VDHACRDELVRKWASNPRVDTDNVQEVDVVWEDGRIRSTLPDSAEYELVVASHVIEHLPDPLGFLIDISNCLGDGVVRLAIPDKRFCFDLFKPVSTAGDFVFSHNTSDQVTLDQCKFLDHLLSDAHCDGEVSWGLSRGLRPKFVSTLDAARQYNSSLNGGNYQDFHRWSFTPSSFSLIMLELFSLGLTDLEITDVRPGLEYEFLCEAKVAPPFRERMGPSNENRRLVLRRQIIHELSVQHQTLA